jgi:rfaE bifunctional protein nucleotidyltransferase chain/domain
VTDVPVVALSELLLRVAELKARSAVVVFTNGVFDLLHRGHVEYLAKSRALGDCLIVGVNSDASVRRLKGPERPVHALGDRMAVLAALRAVDWVVPFDEDTPLSLIEAITPAILVKGGDYRPDDIVGAGWVRDHGGQVVVVELVKGQSTTATIRRLRPEGGGSPP